MSRKEASPRRAAIEDTGRGKGWATIAREAEAELERWVERRRRLRQQSRQARHSDPSRDSMRATGGRADDTEA